MPEKVFVQRGNQLTRSVEAFRTTCCPAGPERTKPEPTSAKARVQKSLLVWLPFSLAIRSSRDEYRRPSGHNRVQGYQHD